MLPNMPTGVQTTFENMFKVLNIGSSIAASASADLSGGARFASEGRNPLKFI